MTWDLGADSPVEPLLESLDAAGERAAEAFDARMGEGRGGGGTELRRAARASGGSSGTLTM